MVTALTSNVRFRSWIGKRRLAHHQQYKEYEAAHGVRRDETTRDYLARVESISEVRS